MERKFKKIEVKPESKTPLFILVAICLALAAFFIYLIMS